MIGIQDMFGVSCNTLSTRWVPWSSQIGQEKLGDRVRAFDKICISWAMAVGVVEQIWNFTTSAVKITQFPSSRFNVDVHQTAGFGLAISFGLPLLVLAVVYYWFGASILSVKSSKSGLKVPPGNPWMLPLCGETFQIAMSFDSYLTSRIQRCGSLSCSHCLPCLLGTRVDSEPTEIRKLNRLGDEGSTHIEQSYQWFPSEEDEN